MSCRAENISDNWVAVPREQLEENPEAEHYIDEIDDRGGAVLLCRPVDDDGLNYLLELAAEDPGPYDPDED